MTCVDVVPMLKTAWDVLGGLVMASLLYVVLCRPWEAP
jgi:hypothetical protein